MQIDSNGQNRNTVKIPSRPFRQILKFVSTSTHYSRATDRSTKYLLKQYVFWTKNCRAGSRPRSNALEGTKSQRFFRIMTKLVWSSTKRELQSQNQKRIGVLSRGKWWPFVCVYLEINIARVFTFFCNFVQRNSHKVGVFINILLSSRILFQWKWL